METLDKAQWLIRVATGEEYGDCETVMGLCIGYAEPGYGRIINHGEEIVVFGNWNPKRFKRADDGTPPLTKAETIGPRLARALEFIGCEIEWYDEWTTCDECQRAMRVQPDSYSWTMFGAWNCDGWTCAECMANDPETYLEEYVNEASRAVTWLGSGELEELGFMQWEPSNPQQYENGWHPGQTDDPVKISEAIHSEDSDWQIVFLIDGVGQFDVRFSAYVRKVEDDD